MELPRGIFRLSAPGKAGAEKTDQEIVDGGGNHPFHGTGQALDKGMC